MLAVDDQVLAERFLEIADVFKGADRVEAQGLGRKKEYGSGNRRLGHGRLVKIFNGRDFLHGKLALKSLVRPLDPGDEAPDFVPLGDLLSNDLFIFAVEAADEPHLFEEILRWIGNEVKNAVFLSNLCSQHGCAFLLGNLATEL